MVHGEHVVQPGTSAVAALIALANARRGRRVGFINSVLYANPGCFRPIVQGDNIIRGVGYRAVPAGTRAAGSARRWERSFSRC